MYILFKYYIKAVVFSNYFFYIATFCLPLLYDEFKQ